MSTRARTDSVRDAATIEELRRELLDGPGVTDRAMREAVLDGGAVPAPVAAYVEKVRRRSYEVTQADLDALRAEGYGEDAVFELTVLAATGAATSIMDATLRAIEDA